MTLSSDVAVRAEGIGKRYKLGQNDTGYSLLTEVLGQRLRSVRRTPPPERDLWALRDVDFEVAEGETFGIIGHNGAGKSTLLKILSRVTPPTEGTLRLRGRVGSLLEVGTGFHQELTGRENIFLNGAILGMSRREILGKFDPIVEFAEVERFIDTPVKRYSTGMYLRLAFAVAAHLEPEILVVDEVLSVGDLAFQEKCLGRMSDVSGEGRTVLFVSHNLSAVSQLCDRAMLLSHGTKLMEGPTQEVIEAYVSGAREDLAVFVRERTDRRGSGRMRFTQVGFAGGESGGGAPTTGEDLDVVLRYESPVGARLRYLTFGLGVATMLGEQMLQLQSDVTAADFSTLPPQGEVRCRIPRCPLPAGRYTVTLFAAQGGEVADWVQRAAELTVTEGDFYGTGRLPSAAHTSVLVDQEWSVAELEGVPAVAGGEPARRG